MDPLQWTALIPQIKTKFLVLDDDDDDDEAGALGRSLLQFQCMLSLKKRYLLQSYSTHHSQNFQIHFHALLQIITCATAIIVTKVRISCGYDVQPREFMLETTQAQVIMTRLLSRKNYSCGINSFFFLPRQIPWLIILFCYIQWLILNYIQLLHAQHVVTNHLYNYTRKQENSTSSMDLMLTITNISSIQML